MLIKKHVSSNFRPRMQNVTPPPEVVEAQKQRPECSIAIEKSTKISFQATEGGGTKETKQNWYLLCPSEPKRLLIHSESHVSPATRESEANLGGGFFGSSPHINTEPLLGDIWRSILRKERQGFHQDGSSSLLDRSRNSPSNSGSISV